MNAHTRRIFYPYPILILEAFDFGKYGVDLLILFWIHDIFYKI